MLPSFRLCRNRGVFIQNKGFRSALVCNNPSVSFHSTAPLTQGSLFGVLPFAEAATVCTDQRLPSFRLCRNRGVFIQNKGFRSALVCNNPSVSFHSTAPLTQGSLFGVLPFAEAATVCTDQRLPSFRLCRNRGVFIQNKGFRSALVCNNPSVSFHSTAPLAQGSLFGILRLRRRQRFVQTKVFLLLR